MSFPLLEKRLSCFLPSFLRSFLLCDSQLLFSRSLSDVPYAFLSARSIGWRARVSNPVTMRPNIGCRIMHLLSFRDDRDDIDGERERKRGTNRRRSNRDRTEIETSEDISVCRRGCEGKHGIRRVSLKRQWVSGQRIYASSAYSERAKRNASFHSQAAEKRNAIALLAE